MQVVSRGTEIAPEEMAEDSRFHPAFPTHSVKEWPQPQVAADSSKRILPAKVRRKPETPQRHRTITMRDRNSQRR
jgi:hypothetical protein